MGKEKELETVVYKMSVDTSAKQVSPTAQEVLDNLKVQVTADPDQMKELSNMINEAVELRLKPMREEYAAWVKSEKARNLKREKAERAAAIAQTRHMRVVESYLKGFNKLLGRKR